MSEHRELPEGRDVYTDRLMRYLIEQTGADLVVDHAERVPDDERVHIGYYAERKKVPSTALALVQNEGLRVIQAGVKETRADPSLPHVEAVGRYSQDDSKKRGWFEAKYSDGVTNDLSVPDGY